jgi:hypothetical protein
MFNRMKNWLQGLKTPEVATEPVACRAPETRAAEPASESSSLPATGQPSESAPAESVAAATPAHRREGRPKIYSSATQRLREWRARKKQEDALAAVEASAALLAPKIACLDLPGGDTPAPAVEPVEKIEEPSPIEMPAGVAAPMAYPSGVTASFIAPVVVQPAIDWAEEARVTDPYGTALPYRSHARIAFLLPHEINESIRRGLNSESERADMEAAQPRLTSVLTKQRIANDRDRIARGSTSHSVDPGRFMVRPGRSERQQIW